MHQIELTYRIVALEIPGHYCQAIQLKAHRDRVQTCVLEMACRSDDSGSDELLFLPKSSTSSHMIVYKWRRQFVLYVKTQAEKLSSKNRRIFLETIFLDIVCRV